MSFFAAHRPPRYSEPIAVVIPSFNDACFLERTLCSVFDQGDPALEIHVVDGGSDDPTLDLLAAYDDQLASWTTAWDSGPAEAINHGLARCRADLVVVLSAHDVLLPGAMHELRQAAANHPRAAWFVGDTQALDEHDYPLADASQTRGFATAANPLNHPGQALLDPAGPPPLSACAFRRDTLELMAGLDTTLRYAYAPDLILRLLDQRFAPQRIAAPFAGIRETATVLVQTEPEHACVNFASPAEVTQRQREALTLFEHYADRLPPAARHAVAREAAERRHLIAITEAQREQPAAPLWLAALRSPWRLNDPTFRRTLLAGQPAQALEQGSASPTVRRAA